MRKTFTAACLFFLVCLVLFSDVHAMDPVTIAILAPIAAKAAEVATPYVIRIFSAVGCVSDHIPGRLQRERCSFLLFIVAAESGFHIPHLHPEPAW